MPEQDYSVQEDQVSPVDMSSMGQPIQANVPTPPPVTPPLSGADRLQQDIIQKYLDLSEDKIKQKKIKEYYEKFGGTGKGFKSGLKEFLYNFGQIQNAKRNGDKYVPPQEAISADARKEYEKESGLLRPLAVEEMRNQKAAAADKAKLAVQGSKNEGLAGTNASKERIAAAKAEIEKVKVEAAAGNQAAQAKWRNIQTAAKAKGLEQYPELLGLPAETQDLLAPYLVKEKNPDMFGNILDTRQAERISSGKMPENNISVAMLPEPEQNAVKKQQEFAAGLKAKIAAARPSSASPYSIQPMTTTDAKGNVTTVPTYIPKTPGTGQAIPVNLPAGMESKNTNKQKIDESFNSGAVQAEGALGTILSTVQQNKEKDITGPAGGNIFSKLGRAYGITEDKPAAEGLLNILASNAALLHSKGMLGGSRFSYKAAEDMSKLLAMGGMSAARAIAVGAASLNYSIQIGKLENAGKLEGGDISNTLNIRMQNEIKRATDQAYADQTWNRLHPQNPRYTKIKLKPISEMLDEDKRMNGTGTADPAKMKSDLASEYGIKLRR